MTDPRQPDAVTADDLLASRALDHDIDDLTPAELAHLESPTLVRRREQMGLARAWLSDAVAAAPSSTAAVEAALAAVDRAPLAEVTAIDRRRRPIWLGAAAAMVVVLGAAVAITRVGGDGSEPMAGSDMTAEVSSAAETRDAPSATAGTTDASTVTATRAEETVVTVELRGAPGAEPFPLPAEGEIVQMSSPAELNWLAQSVAPTTRSSQCRTSWSVLLARALFGPDDTVGVLVEVAIDPTNRSVVAYALDDCAEIASVLID
jgi:hypothetical protein